MFPLLKRLFDFLFALIGIIIASPILAMAIVVLRLTGEGKVFFIQERVGYKNRLFKIYKFTTMLSAAPEQKHQTNIGKRDPRITPIGAFFRMSKIDEIPQLFNVLKGDMSFIGPRALMKVPDFESYPKEVQDNIYNVRPGVSGIGSVVFRDEAQLISQVKNVGKDAGDFKRKVVFGYKGQVEMWYNQNQSLLVDLKILFLTAWTLIFPTSQLAFKLFKDLPERGEALTIELDRMQQLKESVTLLGIVVAVLIPLVPSPFWFWDNLQFILMAAIPVLGFSYLWYRDKEVAVKVVKSDIGWVIFLGLGFLSFFWAINGSLVWYQGFGWLSLILWMLLFRTLAIQETAINIMPLLFCFFFLVMISHHLGALFFNVQIDENWNHFFGKNANYTSTFLVCFYPYLLFFKSKYRIVTYLQLFFTAGILLVLYVTNAHAAILSIVFIGIYYLRNHQPRRDFLSVIGVLASFLFFIITLSFFNPKLVASLPGVKIFTELSTSFKYYLIHNSGLIFLENPLIGIGFGNWHLDAYKTMVSNIPEFNDPNIFSRYRSHNLFSRNFAELGIIGGLAFLYPIIKVLIEGWRSSMKKKYFHQAAYASLMVYLITSFFYNDVNFYEFNFSGIQLLAFCALGILTSNLNVWFNLSKTFKAGCLLLALFSLGWFVYAKFSNDYYWKSKQLINQKKNKSSIEALEKLYHPIFKTTHGFQDKYSHNRSLPFELAQLYQKQKDFDKAELFFEKALVQAPNDENILLNYAEFLFKIRENTSRAKELATKIYQTQNNHYELNLLLSEIAIAEGNYSNAKVYLKVLEDINTQNYGERVKTVRKKIESMNSIQN